MEPDTHTSDLKEKILGRIRSGELSMHSRAYVGLRLALLALVAGLALLIAIFIFTFILFTIRLNIDDAFARGGAQSWMLLLRIFPWWLLVLEIVLLTVTELIMRSFRFAYRSPVLYGLFALLALALALGLFIDRSTRFNDDMFIRAHHHKLPPPVNALYEHAHRDDLFPRSHSMIPRVLFRHGV